MGALGTNIAAFWKQPFSSENSAPMWFFAVGLLLVIIFAWNRILRFIVE